MKSILQGKLTSMKILISRHLALLLCIVTSNALYSQEKIEAVVIDVSDKSPVQYALVSIKSKQVYADADSSGRFTISALDNDTLLISCTGFNEVLVIAGSVRSNKMVELIPKVKTLPTVYTGKFETKMIGIKTAKVSHSYSANLSDRTEFATLIKVPADINLFTVSKVAFGIRNKSKTAAFCNPVRIHVYAVGPDGKPAGELLKEDVIVTEMNVMKNQLVVDIGEQDITLSARSFFVAIQWLSVKDVTDYKQPQISFTIAEKEPLTWRRGNNLNSYQWFNPRTTKVWGNMLVQAQIIVRQ